MNYDNIGVILAGGSGHRMGTDVPKQYLRLKGRMLIEYSIEAFEKNERIDEIAVVVHEDYVPMMRDLVQQCGWKKVRQVLCGGKERYHSSLAAIRAYEALTQPANLIFHDAARPMVTQRIINDVIDALQTDGAVGVAQPCVDTILVADGDYIRQIPPRSTLRRAQTPQGFRLDVIRSAYEVGLADPAFAATDDCGIVLRYRPDTPIRLVSGDECNLKVTYPTDITTLEAHI